MKIKLSPTLALIFILFFSFQNSSKAQCTGHFESNMPFIGPYFEQDQVCLGSSLIVKIFGYTPTSDILWDYGDGSTETTTSYYNSTEHIYTAEGNFNLTATFTDQCGVDTTISFPVVVGHTDFMDTKVYLDEVSMTTCPGDPVYPWTHGGLTAMETVEWRFSDGQTIQSFYPGVEFANEGVVTYDLVMTDYCGNDSTISGQVNVVANPVFDSGISIKNNSDNDTLCLTEEYSLEVEGSYDSVQWTMPDGSIETSEEINWEASSEGVLTITALVTDQCGNDSLFVNTIHVGNRAGFSEDISVTSLHGPVCPNEDYVLQVYGPVVSADWAFSDSTYQSGDRVTVSSSDEGYYYFSVNMSDVCGNTKEIVGSVAIEKDSVFDSSIRVFAPDSVCKNESSYFSVWYSDSAQWLFSDGQSFSEANFYASFQNDGLYTYTVQITDGCGNDSTFTGEVYVGAKGEIDPNLYLHLVGDDEYCPGEEVEGTIWGGDYDYAIWTFSNGTVDTSYDGNFTNYGYVTFDQTGTHSASVEVIDLCGNSGTLNIEIPVIGNKTIPSFYADFTDTVCQHNREYFEVYPKAKSTVWTFNNASQETGLEDYTHTFVNMDSPGTVTFTVVATDFCDQHVTLTEELHVVAAGVDNCPASSSINNEGESNIVVYPNPASETLFLKGPKNGELVRILSVNGRSIKTVSYNGNGIDVSTLTSGLYFIQVGEKVVRFGKY